MTEIESAIIAAAEAHIGDPYVFGAWGGRCTPAYRQQYAGYNPAHATAIYKACPVLSDRAESCAGCKWDGALAFDCRGFTHWCLMQGGIDIAGGGATSQYNTDKNWARRGIIAEMPDLLCCVFRQSDKKMLHTGLHIGGGQVIHCSGKVKTGTVNPSDWTHYAIPRGLYDDTTDAEVLIVTGTLKRGSKGDAVKELQASLNQLGYSCGEADGKFGQKTEAAVASFQKDHGLTADGIVGVATQTAIHAALTNKPEQPVASDVDILRARIGDIDHALSELTGRVAALEQRLGEG